MFHVRNNRKTESLPKYDFLMLSDTFFAVNIANHYN